MSFNAHVINAHTHIYILTVIHQIYFSLSSTIQGQQKESLLIFVAI